MIDRQSSGSSWGAAGRVSRAAVLVLAAYALVGCSRAPRNAVSTQGPAVRTPAQASTITAADLKEAERITKAYWEAAIAGKYTEMVQYTEVALVPEAQRQAFAQQVARGMKKLKPTSITSLGPARQDASRPGTILVPYSVAAAEKTSEEAAVRREGPSQGWLIFGGI